MPPETSLPLTLEEHRELGKEITKAKARLQELASLVRSVYGPQNQAAFTFQKLTECMNRLVGDMQAQAAEDLPGYDVDGLYR